MFTINSKSKSLHESKTQVASGFQITFENGNTISVQFGWGNYCENRDESKPTCVDAEIAIWNSDNKWYDFGSDTVQGWCTPNEVAEWIHFASTTTF